MKRKKYQTPAMQVVKIQQCSMLTASAPQAAGENFTWDEEQ